MCDRCGSVEATTKRLHFVLLPPVDLCLNCAVTVLYLQQCGMSDQERGRLRRLAIKYTEEPQYTGGE